MSKTGRKISGFFKAMILALVSFFVIFLFFPDVSEKLFGISLKSSPEITQKADEVVSDVKETTSNIVKETVQNTTENVLNSVLNNSNNTKDDTK